MCIRDSTGIALGLIGVIVQFVSGTLSEGGATLAFTIYLLGAFVSGFCVCILNLSLIHI